MMKPLLTSACKASRHSLLCLALALLPAITPAADAPAPAPAEAAKPALTVTAISPVRESWAISIDADGAISPWQEAVVAAETGGLRVTDVLVDVGSTVKRGQTLATLSQDTIKADIAKQMAVIAQTQAELLRAQSGIAQAESGVLQAQAGVVQSEAGLAQANATITQAQAGLNQASAMVAQAQAGITQANASFNEAKVNADRARRLKQTGALPMQQIEQYLTGEATARAGVESQKAAFNAQKAALEGQKANLNAQKAGLAAKQADVKAQLAVVQSRQEDVKAQQAAVGAQQAAIKVQEAALESLKIQLAKTEIVAADDGVISSRSVTLGSVVQPGSELFRLIRQDKLEWRAAVPGTSLGQIHENQAATITLPTGETVQGKVRLVSPLLDSNTRQASVYITLPEGSSARAGMFVQGTISQGEAEALTLPQTAVILRDGNHYVFEIGADNRVTQHPVKTGRRWQDRVEILSDLPENAKFVATGGAFINDNDLVQLAGNASLQDAAKPQEALGAKP